MPLSAWLGWKELAAAGLAVAASVGASVGLRGAIDHERDKVHYLMGEVAKLDRDIAEVASLKQVIQALLARKQIVDALRGDRLRSVRLLEEAARRRPDGVYLGALREQGGQVFLAGFAASEREVSALLDRLAGSALFEKPQLIEVRREGAPARAGYATRFAVSMALKGKAALPRSSPPRFPSDVHPGDPK